MFGRRGVVVCVKEVSTSVNALVAGNIGVKRRTSRVTRKALLGSCPSC